MKLQTTIKGTDQNQLFIIFLENEAMTVKKDNFYLKVWLSGRLGKNRI